MKTYVLDASALFIFLQKKASAPKVSEILKESLRERVSVLMSPVNYGEVYALMLSRYEAERAAGTMGTIHSLPIQMVDATPPRAMRAAEVKFRYKLHYTDSFAAALAIDHKATLVTSDSDFRSLGNTVSILWLKQ